MIGIVTSTVRETMTNTMLETNPSAAAASNSAIDVRRAKSSLPTG